MTTSVRRRIRVRFNRKAWVDYYGDNVNGGRDSVEPRTQSRAGVGLVSRVEEGSEVRLECMHVHTYVRPSTCIDPCMNTYTHIHVCGDTNIYNTQTRKYTTQHMP